MNFIDEVKVFIKSGRGGDGCSSFHRSRSNPRGGPDGGDGGKGGSVFFHATHSKSTLLDLKFIDIKRLKTVPLAHLETKQVQTEETLLFKFLLEL